MSDKQSSHDVETLLPWYATGTLNENETDRVAAELESLPNGATLLRDEVRLSRRIARDTSGVAGLLDRQAAAYEQLRAQVLAAPDSVANERIRSRGPSRRWMAALSISLIVSAAALAWLMPGGDTARYSTLTNSTDPTAGIAVQVAVTSAATPAQIRQLANRLNASIVSGPSRHNVYVIALPNDADLARDLAWLRTQSEVTFAEAESR